MSKRHTARTLISALLVLLIVVTTYLAQTVRNDAPQNQNNLVVKEKGNEDRVRNNVSSLLARAGINLGSPLAHVAAADWIWLCRWTGESPKGWPTWCNGSVGEIHEEWRRINAGRKEFIEGLTDADLDKEISFTRINGESDRAKLWFLLHHVANHATYHRGQVASQLRMVGAVPPSTDLLRYRPWQKDDL